jgi:hypothetical protein
MKYEPEAIYIAPPTGSDQLFDGLPDGNHAQLVPFTTSSGAAVQIVGAGYFTLTADQNVQMRFWKDNSAGVNTASDFPLWQFAYLNMVLDGRSWVRLKGLTSSGNLYVYQSSP